MDTYVSAIFNTYAQANGAISELRSLGVPDSHLSIVARHTGDHETLGERIATEDVSDAATTGLVSGAGIGALFGLAAAVLIPGAVPFMAAGALVTAFGLDAAIVATGVVAGAAAGSLAGSLAQIGYDEAEANFYSAELELGHMFVSIHKDDHVRVSAPELASVLARHGGRSAGNAVAV
jgi:hypothetical protein